MTVWWPKHVASNLNNKILLCLTENVYIRCLSVSIFVCRNIKCNTLYIIYYITEACAIQLDSTYNEIGILTIYISPRGNFTNFLNRLDLILQKLYSSKYSIIICGDVNVYCLIDINPYPTAFPYGNGMVLHFYQQQESSTTKTVHKVINKGLKTYV